MATFRTIKERGDFVTVNKMFIFDERLSAKAKGILLYFLSRPDDWQIYTSEVVKHMNDGQKSINNGIKELMECKYVHRIQKRKDSGVFSGYEYHVYERPTEMPLSENGLSENGKTENRKGQTTNNNITNNDLTKNNRRVDFIPYKKIIDYLNEKTGKRFSHKSKANQRLIKARFNEGYTLDDFINVIDTKTNEWKDVDKMKGYLQPTTLFGNKFDKYLNQEVTSQVDNNTDVFDSKMKELFGE
ncbi:conserved phage C-terminal domain-containing protein [Staphylococcus pettenkoferi]|uniref:conserved phage C-terminal domain-containing protein n=1 Tax=Staphylococcus pettenkoferi TaxID=170573 RepID=UPI002552A030|nr:conserved phage C-terminal domain-containing protein [Staphylococcus pettenkoferi]MDK7115723.1 conserved phage C-terminal domain-containing protein [Staphylococcus pettenkoferi]MDK7284434.1 conserved phage C-terminal domain-containing protein [Staphylococcus pettenkoferi]